MKLPKVQANYEEVYSRTTPAQAAGVEQSIWTVADLIEARGG